MNEVPHTFTKLTDGWLYLLSFSRVNIYKHFEMRQNRVSERAENAYCLKYGNQQVRQTTAVCFY